MVLQRLHWRKALRPTSVPGGAVLLIGRLSLALLLFVSASCDRNSRTDDVPVQSQQRPMRDINDVLKDHTAELMAHPGVAGVYVGQQDDGASCITVMVVQRSDSLDAALPDSLEGYPVVVEETGEIRPMRDRDSS